MNLKTPSPQPAPTQVAREETEPARRGVRVQPRRVIGGVLALLLVALNGWAQPTLVPPRKATPEEVAAGVNDTKYATPYAIATSGISSNGITAAGATNIVNGMRTQSAFSIGGNAATATMATNNPAGSGIIGSNFFAYFRTDDASLR